VNGAFAFWSQGTGDPGGGFRCQRHHRDALPVHARHLRRHAPRYHLRHRDRNARRRRAGDARLLLSRIATTSQTRRPLFSGVAAGQHERGDHALGQQERVRAGAGTSISTSSNAPWRATFPIRSRPPPPWPWRPTFDTDNTYKLSPQRLVWNIQKLGLLGEIDHYCGVFWWKQAVASNPSYPQCTVTFSGQHGTIRHGRLAVTSAAPRSGKRCSAGRTAATPSPGTSPISSTRSSTAPGPRPPAAS
jgi:hypothetical protein